MSENLTPEVSVIIPARNEIYLEKTIQDILTKAEGDIEVIAVLDGYWPNPPLKDDDRLIILHRGRSMGMRSSINSAVAIAKGKYIMKCDAHCMFNNGFDRELASYINPNWVVVPRRKRLDAVNWCVQNTDKPDIDYEYLTYPNSDGNWKSGLHGRVWDQRAKERAKILIDDNMSAQGSCWFMNKDYFHKLDLEDEVNYGTFYNEFQEIGLKCWLSGGRVVTNKKTWYAHFHKDRKMGRGYSMDKRQIVKGAGYTKRWLTNTAWHKQTRPFTWLIEKFWPVPGWPEDKTKWTPIVKNEETTEMDIWKTGNESELAFWKDWLKRNGTIFQQKRRLSNLFNFMIGSKKEVTIANLGAGAMCLIGDSRRDVKVKVVSSDLLANEFEKLRRELDFTTISNPIEMQDMTNLTYKDSSFDIVYCANALDHCKNPYKALTEMVRICKPGGWIYLKHFAHEGKRHNYRGLHQWNLDATEGGDCIIWNKSSLPSETFPLSDICPGFTTQVKPMRKMMVLKAFVQKK